LPVDNGTFPAAEGLEAKPDAGNNTRAANQNYDYGLAEACFCPVLALLPTGHLLSKQGGSLA
jgi:hypothetical protein